MFFIVSKFKWQVKNLRAVTQRLAAEIADKSTLATGLLYRAEDARIRNDGYRTNTFLL